MKKVGKFIFCMIIGYSITLVFFVSFSLIAAFIMSCYRPDEMANIIEMYNPAMALFFWAVGYFTCCGVSYLRSIFALKSKQENRVR